MLNRLFQQWDPIRTRDTPPLHMEILMVSDELRDKFERAMEEQQKYFNDLVENCDPDTKLAITAWVMRHIVEHAKSGGTYRYLIYTRLGFGPEAYVPLCDDGLTISNEFNLED